MFSSDGLLSFQIGLICDQLAEFKENRYIYIGFLIMGIICVVIAYV